MNTKWSVKLASAAIAAGVIVGLSACGSNQTSPDASGDTIVVGSQAYYSNEIIAEIYAQALEAEGFSVERQFQLGQRDVTVPALTEGEVDLFPEYSGNLLQFFDPEVTVTEPEAIYSALVEVLPENLTALAMSPATDQDSYNVTAEFAEANNLTSIADLANVSDLTLGGMPELAERPYGPTGLKDLYGVSVTFEATGDTTVDALVEGLVDLANVYSADPRIAQFDLVTLEDPKGLFIAQNVVPIANSDIATDISAIIDPISKAMTPEMLSAMNVQSVDDKMSAAEIASAWLSENGFVK